MLDCATLFFLNMSPAERKIFKVIMDLQKKKIIDPDKYKDINPSRKTLAKQAGNYSESSVKKLLKKFTSTLLFVKTRKKKNGYNESNVYKIDQEFFEFMVLMDSCGFLNNVKKFKEIVLQGLGENENFLYEKYMKSRGLSTTNVPAAMLKFVPALKTYLKTNMSIVHKNGAVNEQIQEIKEKDSFKVLCSANLTFSDKERLSKTFGIYALKEAMENLRYCGTHNIQSHVRFIYAKAKLHTLKYLNAA